MTTVIKTRQGEVRGRVDEGVQVFKGIPYAAPPVGANRLRPAQPVAWSGVRDALAFGPKTFQPTYPPVIRLLLQELTDGGDDCLTLNVWSPAVGTAGHPVMVWIPGGMFEFHGTGASPWYDGSRFARDGIVCVTINYRVGADGFLYYGRRTREHRPARPDRRPDLGARQHRRLRRRSRQRHGVRRVGWRDERRRAAVHAPRQGTVPARHPPERRGTSGDVGRNGAPRLRAPREEAWRRRHSGGDRQCPGRSTASGADRVARGARCGSGSDSAGAKRSRSAGCCGSRSSTGTSSPPIPSIGLLPARPTVSTSSSGTNTDEHRLFLASTGAIEHITDEALAGAIAAYGLPVDDTVRAYRAAHPGGSAGDLLAAIQTDWYWRMPAIRLAEAHAKHGARTYMYEFAWRSPQFNDRLGCVPCARSSLRVRHAWTQHGAALGSEPSAAAR